MRLVIIFSSVLGLLLTTSSGLSQAQPGRTFAFLVACGDYDKAHLDPVLFTVGEMKLFRDVLISSGVAEQNIIFLHDDAKPTRRFTPTRDNIVTEFKLMMERLRPEDSVVVALSGHGVQFKGDKYGYFCPLNAELDKKHKLLPMEGEDGLLTMLDQGKAGRKLLIVNACRNQPPPPALAKLQLELRDEYNEEAPKGTVMLLACKQNQLSWFYRNDEKRIERRNRSLFMYHLTEAWKGSYAQGKKVTVDHVVAEVADRVETDAVADFGRNQIPIVKRKFTGKWELTTALAKQITNSIGMKLAYIPPGKFMMGSPKDERNREIDELQHEVELTKGFYMGIHEVTIGQFKQFIAASKGYQTEAEKDGEGGWGFDAGEKKLEGRKPQYTWKHTGWDQTDLHPVVNVTWEDAKAFCSWLSEKEGMTYTLPSEAQWEYACRAGTSTAYYSGDDAEALAPVGNVADTTFRAKVPSVDRGIKASDGYAFTAPVGQFKQNAFGLFDMHGNVWEWCEDWYGKDYYEVAPKSDPLNTKKGVLHVMRGGSWFDFPKQCRAAYRSIDDGPDNRCFCIGFRVVLATP